ncbi:MAG: IS91 family transposase [Pelosinus sp.]|nr:IS91 family transposase [Pelosinus sp.]
MIELQDIFSKYEQAYKKQYKISIYQEKAITAIKNCRTSFYGAHIDVCDECGKVEVSYNSCRNRHCPKCQTISKERWLDARKDELLPIKYFHAVFTVPDDLNPLIYQNKRVMYNLIFKTASETVQELSQDKKYIGGQIGITAILHTWGQNLMFHPHIHMIIPAGALTDANQWQKSKEKFFIPVKVLSRKFRGKLLHYIKENWTKLKFSGKLDYLNGEQNFKSLMNTLYEKDWVVYCKKPFKSCGHVIEYLGRYTHRVAISNNRIINLENDMVTFKWRDYKDGSKLKEMTLSAIEFMRRFLLHILPTGFTKIRHYGFLGNRNKNTKLRLCQKLTGGKMKPLDKKRLSATEIILKISGRDITKCSCCGCTKQQYRLNQMHNNAPPVRL